MQTKKVPMRMCVGCREMKPKRELVRVVRAPDGGDISIDFKGKKPGRGAYVCRDAACFARARKIKAFERTFECEIPAEVYSALEAEMKNGETDE